MSLDADAAAAALHRTRRKRGILHSLPPALAPATESEGAAVQYALARRLDALPPAGFKIGATARTMQEYLGLAGPAAGFMPGASLRPDGTSVPYASFLNPGVECELAVRLGRDLPPGSCTAAQAEAAVADLFAAIEIVEQRYGDLRVLGTPTLIADQVFHAAAVLGPPAPGWRELDLTALPGRILVDGTERFSGRGGDLLGHPMQALAWLAGSSVVAAFGGLRAGQVVMLGSVTPPVWLPGSAVVQVEFPPLPPVHLRLA
ncbi:MAG TPA: fumarylacetoacetate hydrolase family protein [Acetobacteraceae bacterium]|nr:fumarylacetoacetate hydrolase family protein [Acetobacteraceae bacterium]